MSFFNSHNHTMYSNLRLLDSIIKPTDLIDKAIQLGLSGVAITDHESLSAHMAVNMYAKKIKEKYPDFTIALGNEIYLTKDREKGQPYYHFILLAKDAIGHKGLRELSSTAWYNSFFDRGMERVPLIKSELQDIMQKYKGHIMGTTACLGGELPKMLMARQLMKTVEVPTDEIDGRIADFLQMAIDVFGKENFFIECAPSSNTEQITANKLVKNIADQYGLRLIVATDSHYLGKDTRFAHKAYLNSKGGDREVDTFYEFARLMDEQEVRELLELSFPKARDEQSYESRWFHPDHGINYMYDDREEPINLIYDKNDLPKFVSTIDTIFQNNEYMRQQIEFYSLERSQQIPTIEVPKRSAGFYGWSIGQEYITLSNINEYGTAQEQYWLDCCMEGLKTVEGYYQNEDIYMARLETEADVITFIGERLGESLFAYFNTFKHYIDLFWDCGSIVGPGRGSATGFLSNYLLGITQLDPIKWKLPWWRLTLIKIITRRLFQ